MNPQSSDDSAILCLQELPAQQWLSMYDLLPEILFWVKNRHGQIIHANKAFLEHIGGRSLEQTIGLYDHDFAPAHIAKQFIEDDKRVIKGEAVTDRLEMNIIGTADIGWFSTSKRPLLDATGRIVGSFGVSRHLEKTSIALSGIEALKIPVSYIRKHFMRPITLHELAEVSHLSISALERRFKKYLSKTPKQFITDIRLENARRQLVETTAPIAVIADQSGFSDPSYFSRRFQRKFAQLPSDFRLEHQHR